MTRYSTLNTKPNTTADITEIFSSIQGEGIFIGLKQIFVRFKDCNLECSFCDERVKRAESTAYSTRELTDRISSLDRVEGPHHSVSFTGGEPLLCADYLKKTLGLLKNTKLRAYLETNGTLPERLKDVIGLIDIIAMDFKLPSSTGESEYWYEHKAFLKIASSKDVFVKAVITSNTVREDIEKAISLISQTDENIPLILQPATLTGTFKNRPDMDVVSDFVELCLKGGLVDVRVIPQIHKMLGIK